MDENLFSLDLQELDLVQLANDVIKETMSQIADKKIKISLRCSNNSLNVIGDKIRLNQVFLNLINNAIKYTSEGDIIVSIKMISENSKSKNDNNDNVALVQIIDTGLGISPDIKQKLFSKFTKGSKIGTGLGLFICKNIVESHGGKIWAENNVDKGATFSFTIPTKTE
jgi:signal transduction histidine kinase